MKENHHKELARYRLEKANRNLMSARQAFHLGNYDDAVSRSYYCILTTMRALLALHHQDSQRHEGVITLFNKYFIQPKLFPRDINKIIHKMKSLREDADYGDFIEITGEIAEKEIRKAEVFMKNAEEIFSIFLTDTKNHT